MTDFVFYIFQDGKRMIYYKKDIGDTLRRWEAR
jgi:hypothetical protein